jgi:hypothetical protein
MHKLRFTIGGVVAAVILALAPAAAQASTPGQAGAGTAASSASSLRLASGQSTSSAAASLPGGVKANARAAGDTYAKGYAEVCNDIHCSGWSTTVYYAVTWNGVDVWINGYPSCYEHGTSITWCGYGDNGQKVIGIGDNFGTSGQWHVRIYVYGDGGGCDFTTTLGVFVAEGCA